MRAAAPAGFRSGPPPPMRHTQRIQSAQAPLYGRLRAIGWARAQRARRRQHHRPWSPHPPAQPLATPLRIVTLRGRARRALMRRALRCECSYIARGRAPAGREWRPAFSGGGRWQWRGGPETWVPARAVRAVPTTRAASGQTGRGWTPRLASFPPCRGCPRSLWGRRHPRKGEGQGRRPPGPRPAAVAPPFTARRLQRGHPLPP